MRVRSNLVHLVSEYPLEGLPPPDQFPFQPPNRIDPFCRNRCGCGFRTMAIRIPKRCRSRLRSDADHDSDAMPITNRDRFGMVIDMS